MAKHPEILSKKKGMMQVHLETHVMASKGAGLTRHTFSPLLAERGLVVKNEPGKLPGCCMARRWVAGLLHGA